MGRFSLEFKCTLENVKEFFPDGEDFRWYLKIKCTQCGEVPDKWQYVTLCETHETQKGRSTAHLVAKCKVCLRDNITLIIEENAIKPYVFHEEKDGEFQSVVIFECRGCEPIDFDPRTGWTAKCLNSSTSFTPVDLGEKDWVEYDEKAQETVGIYELEYRFKNI